jgi:hypothetical protein
MNTEKQLGEQEERINELWKQIVDREAREHDANQRLAEVLPKLESLENMAKGYDTRFIQLEDKMTELDLLIKEKNQEVDEALKPGFSLLAEIKTLYEDYFFKPEATIKSKVEKLTEHHSTIEKFEQSSFAVKKEIEDFRDAVYGNEESKIKGLKKELEDLVTKHQASNDEWKGTYGTLYDKINGLLPGATATGLAKAYQDQRKSYFAPILAWSIVFALTIIGMIWFAISSYVEYNTFEDSLSHILSRLPFFIPAIWLAFFASKRQNQNMRLLQEYAYKEALAKSYEGHKREIDKLPEGDTKNELLAKHLAAIVDMCGYNPSMTLENKSHDEKPPSLLDFLRPKRSTSKT